MVVRDDNAIKMPLSDAEMVIVRHYASHAEIGGESHVRSNERRKAKLSTDQLIGQMAQYAGTKYLTGGMKAYRQARQVADTYPTNGDGGFDVPGLTVDFKGSQKKGRDIWDLHLPVRPDERHEGWTYILCLCDIETPAVYLAGWAHDSELPDEPDQDGPLRGAYTIPSSDLNALPPFKWHPE